MNVIPAAIFHNMHSMNLSTCNTNIEGASMIVNCSSPNIGSLNQQNLKNILFWYFIQLTCIFHLWIIVRVIYLYFKFWLCRGEQNPNVPPLPSGQLFLPYILPPWASIILFDTKSLLPVVYFVANFVYIITSKSNHDFELIS